MALMGGLSDNGLDIELRADSLRLFADSYNLPVMFFIQKEGVPSPELSYMNGPARNIFYTADKLSSTVDIYFVISSLFDETQSTEILKRFLEKGEFRGKALLRLQENDQAEVILRRLNFDKPEYLAVMVIDRKRTDEEILRRYPAMLQRFELSYGMVRHDLQNHITALSSYLELCIRDESTEVRNNNIVRMSAIIQEMSKYVRNMGGITPNPVVDEWRKLSDIIHSGISDLPIDGVNTNVSCSNIELRSDPLLPMVFYNLAYNSIRHGKHVRNINISCEFEVDALKVIYSDDGQGIDPMHRSKLFSPPSEGERPHALFLIRQILFLLGITIAERGEYGSGVRFEISVPESHFRMNTNLSQDIG